MRFKQKQKTVEKALWLFGGELTIIAGEEENKGQYNLIAGLWLPGLEIPLHMHTKYSESIYLTEAEMTVYTPENVQTLRAGDYVYIYRLEYPTRYQPGPPRLVGASPLRLQADLPV